MTLLDPAACVTALGALIHEQGHDAHVGAHPAPFVRIAHQEAVYEVLGVRQVAIYGGYDGQALGVDPEGPLQDYCGTHRVGPNRFVGECFGHGQKLQWTAIQSRSNGEIAPRQSENRRVNGR